HHHLSARFGACFPRPVSGGAECDQHNGQEDFGVSGAILRQPRRRFAQRVRYLVFLQFVTLCALHLPSSIAQPLVRSSPDTAPKKDGIPSVHSMTAPRVACPGGMRVRAWPVVALPLLGLLVLIVLSLLAARNKADTA